MPCPLPEALDATFECETLALFAGTIAELVTTAGAITF